jgi:DNA-directed RNA polymerase subunit L
MNPQISHLLEDNHQVLRFTLSHANVSIANAIRRVILSEIPICCIRTDTNTITNQRWDMCHIQINTSRLHNEIIKQRISLVPVHTTDVTYLPNQWELVVDVSNDSEKVIYVTTEHFRLRKKNTHNLHTQDISSISQDTREVPEEWMPLEQVRQIFPPCLLGTEADNYIDIARLRPSNGTGIPGERLTLVADFGIATAKENSMYNATSCCTYACTMDKKKQQEQLHTLLGQWRANHLSEEEIKFQTRNFELLDAQRCIVPDSFEFQIQTIGIYSNEELLWMAIRILRDRFIHTHTGLMARLYRNDIRILRTVCTIPHCWDIYLEQEDETFGKLMELILYEEWFVKQQQITFCSFHKLHPHDTYGILRVALQEETTSCLEKLREESSIKHLNKLSKDSLGSHNSEQETQEEEQEHVLGIPILKEILHQVCFLGGHIFTKLLPREKRI